MFASKRNILWLDCIGGLIVGVAVLTFFRAVGSLGGLQTAVVIGMGLANLLYGSYSLFVATRKPRPRRLVEILAYGNMAWLGVCVLVTFLEWDRVTPLGILHVIGEGIYVAGLGIVEWFWRHELGV